VVDDPSVDAVVVATRHGDHADLAVAALDAGKHVFVEKPLALGARELDRVLAAARASRRVLTVGFNRRFAPQVVAVRALAERAGGPVATVYRVNAGAVPQGAWLHDLEQGGGRLIGEVCHFFDTIAFLSGSPIVEVHAAGFGAPGQPVQAHDNLVVNLTLADRSVATVAYLAGGAPGVAKERVELFAGGCTAILDDFTTLELHDGPKPRRERLRRQDKGHDAELRAFLAAVRQGGHPIPLDEIEAAHRACFAAVDSLRTGRAVRVVNGD
jgi:predicted dehydrogenase